MDEVFIEELDPVLMNYTEKGKRKIKEKYKGDIRPAEFATKETGKTYLYFFQHDREGKEKGVVKLTPFKGDKK